MRMMNVTPTARQIELEAAVDAVLDANDYEMDLTVAACEAAKRTGIDPVELETAYCIVNDITPPNQ